MVVTIKNRELFKPFRKYWLKISLAFLLASIATAASFVSVKVLALFVDKLSGENSFNILLNLIVIWLLTELTGYICNYFAAIWISKIKANIRLEIQMNFFRQISNSTIQSINAFTPNALGALLQDDPMHVVDAVFNILKEILNVLLGLVSLVYIWKISSEIFVLFVFSLLVILFTQIKMKEKQIACFDKSRKASVYFRTISEEVFRNFSAIIVQHLQPGIKPEVSNTVQHSKKAELNNELIIHKNRLITCSISLVSQTALLIFGTMLYIAAKLSYADFLEIYLYKGKVYDLATISLQITKELSRFRSAVTRLNGLSLALNPREYGSTRPDTITGTIEVAELSAYVGTDNHKVLDNVSFHIKDGEFIGIVGPSGCGKSTLLKCITQVLPHSGKITISGVPLEQLTEGSLRRLICFTQQAPHWFDFLSVRENLTLHCPGVEDHEIWHALEKACIYDMIKQKGGLDIHITRNEMSGGQLQRLALAILVLSKSRILLLDESTSALDGDSQKSIVSSIRKTTSNKEHTVLFVAHRISALRDADRIIVMDNGHIVDIGTYNELNKRCELFRNLAQNS